MENETEQTTHETPYKEEPSLLGSFFKKHGTRIIRYTVLSAVTYGLMTFMLGIINCNMPARYEESNPRRYEKSEKETPMSFKAIRYLADNYGDKLMMVINAPWRAMNLVTTERYEKVRKQAFEIAGIDETNPKHDTKRFKLYRQLEIAVRETEDPSQAAYIPFKKLKEYIEQNSSQKINKKWKEYLNEETYKGRLMLQGKAYYKADKNKDGLVTDGEWEKTLHEMGYKSQKDVLEEITEKLQGKNKEEIKTELENIIKKSKENKNYLTGNIPETVPIQKLKDYTKQ